jgi:hypothetical protein
MPGVGDYSVVRYWAGTDDDVTFVALNLNDSGISVGRGPVCEMTDKEGTVAETELSEGRRLFTDDRIKYYWAQSGPDTVIHLPSRIRIRLIQMSRIQVSRTYSLILHRRVANK